MRRNKNDRNAVVLRDMRAEDYDALVKLWRAAGLPYKPEGRDARDAIARQLRRRTAAYVVAEVRAKVVGAVLGTHDNRKGWINRLAVLPAYRRRRVAARLVAEVERRFAASGIDIFACFIENGNDVSKAFFEELGYERFGDVSYYRKRKYNNV